MNPVLPVQSFIPDGEGRWMPDGRFYVYGSCDVCGAEDFYCSDVLHVFSSGDLVHWVDHGVCLRSSDITWAQDCRMLYAPDCIYKDGKYYLYFCMNDGREGVATADTPYGYFCDPVPVEYANGDGIDPAVLVDDDGQVYYFWGQFSLRGARVKEDMRSLDLSTLQPQILTERQHGFHEGASIRKHNGLYYLVFTDISRGRATCLSYAVSRSPLGPYEKRGTIIDNIFCDPETWNDHGSIAEFNGQWYVLYHRSSQNTRYNRRLCMEPIFFEENGDIKEVPMTTQGVEPPLKMNEKISAARACMMRGGAYIKPVRDGSFEVLSHFSSRSYAAYRYLDFDAPEKISITASCVVPHAQIEVWADDKKLGVCSVENTGGWENWEEFSCVLEPVTGIRTLYFVCSGESGGMGNRMVEIKDFTFFSSHK